MPQSLLLSADHNTAFRPLHSPSNSRATTRKDMPHFENKVLQVLRAGCPYCTLHNAKHLTVESYTVVMLLTFILIIISIPSPPHSFIPDLKPSFSAYPPHHSLPFFFRTDYIHGFPRLFTVTSEHIRFLLYSFSLFLHFQLSVPCGKLSRLMSAFERTLK